MEEIPLYDVKPHASLLGGAGPVHDGTTTTTTRKDDSPETVKRKRIIKGQASDTHDKYRPLLQDPRWSPIEYTAHKGVQCWELPVTDDGLYSFKASGIVEWKTADSIARAHMNTDRIPRTAWDKDITDIRLLETVSYDEARGLLLTVQYAEHTPPVPFSKREFVYFQWSHQTPSKKNESDSEWLILTRHTDHPDRPLRDDVVRALSMSSMTITPLTPKPDPADKLVSMPRTQVTLMAWIKPGGNIPDAAVKLYKTKLADRIGFLRDTSFQ